MVRTKLYLEESFLSNYYVSSHLQFLVIQSMMDINEDFPKSFTKNLLLLLGTVTHRDNF